VTCGVAVCMHVSVSLHAYLLNHIPNLTKFYLVNLTMVMAWSSSFDGVAIRYVLHVDDLCHVFTQLPGMGDTKSVHRLYMYDTAVYAKGDSTGDSTGRGRWAEADTCLK